MFHPLETACQDVSSFVRCPPFICTRLLAYALCFLVCPCVCQDVSSFGNSLSRCVIFRQVARSFVSLCFVCCSVCIGLSGCFILWQQPVKMCHLSSGGPFILYALCFVCCSVCIGLVCPCVCQDVSSFACQDVSSFVRWARSFVRAYALCFLVCVFLVCVLVCVYWSVRMFHPLPVKMCHLSSGGPYVYAFVSLALCVVLCALSPVSVRMRAKCIMRCTILLSTVCLLQHVSLQAPLPNEHPTRSRHLTRNTR